MEHCVPSRVDARFSGPPGAQSCALAGRSPPRTTLIVFRNSTRLFKVVTASNRAHDPGCHAPGGSVGDREGDSRTAANPCLHTISRLGPQSARVADGVRSPPHPFDAGRVTTAELDGSGRVVLRYGETRQLGAAS